MKIAISGSHGLIGTECCRRLESAGHTVLRLVRGKAAGEQEILADFDSGRVDLRPLEGCGAVLHLAGASIAAHRWTSAYRKTILKSRTESTRMLVEAILQLQNPPQTFLSASAVGVYGSRKESELTEDSAPGHGFLSEVVQQWESSSRPLADRGIRVVYARFGAVMSKEGGALQKMLLPFRLGLGGRIGTGTQYLSWISLRDAVRALEHLLQHEEICGPVNVVAPESIRNIEFAQELAAALHRPAWIPIPAFAARLALGALADEILLASQRTLPRVLLESGFGFSDPQFAPFIAAECVRR